MVKEKDTLTSELEDGAVTLVWTLPNGEWYMRVRYPLATKAKALVVAVLEAAGRDRMVVSPSTLAIAGRVARELSWYNTDNTEGVNQS